ncbi:MAG: hypothetical protein LC679_11920 [Intrasporangiaceae bacterium]|nr:hypothetical protein [Intrasporangiaceae bacterium]
MQLGAAWLTEPHAQREVTWHNGGTGGFRSFVGVDHAAGRGVAMVLASTRKADKAGFDLLTQPPHTDPSGAASEPQ